MRSPSSPEGLTVAHSDTLQAIADRLRVQADRCSHAAHLGRISEGPDIDDTLARHLTEGVRGAEASASALRGLADRIGMAGDLLSTMERAVASGMEALAGQVAAAVGLIGSRLAFVGALAAAGAVLPIAARVAVMPEPERDQLLHGVGVALRSVGDSIGRTLSADGVGWLMALSDDALLGALHVPPALVPVLGEEGLGLAGVDDTARSIVGLAVIAGISGVAPARVVQRRPGDAPSVTTGDTGAASSGSASRGGERHVPAPAGVADRAARLPDGAGEQIRIERYATLSGEHFEVYVAGTDPAAALGGANPWDMASNIALLAEQRATSTRAVELALSTAGAGPTSSVVFIGHSQGAMVATDLAESGQWSTAGLVTIGGPAGATAVTGGYPAIVIEHADDPIVGAAGRPPATEAQVVRLTAYPEGAPDTLAAHASERYHETAGLVDQTSNIAVADAVARLPRLDGQGVVMMFRAERVAPADPRAP